ncbi:MAG TPA: RDD family protein [Luteitalea sp.]|nr:RDD family protein [Luteitalea sp.]
MTTDAYLAQVLAHLPPTTPTRAQIAVELRGHIEERLAAGQPLADVLRQLGDPAALAESYLSGVPLASADFGARFVAKIIDVAIPFAIAAALACLAWLAPVEILTGVLFVLAILVAGFGYVLYTIVAEWRTGQTIGKRRYGLYVRQESGAPITLGQSIVRQLPAFLQVMWIDALFALFTDRRQRAFELLSKTRVVQVDPSPGR